jgi:hypothetical protein
VFDVVPGTWSVSGIKDKPVFKSLLTFFNAGGYLEIELSLEVIVLVIYEISLDVTFEKSLTPSNCKSNGFIDKVKLFKSIWR